MTKERLTAFEDAILAIIMTILVLELKKPTEVTVQGLWDLRANFFAYALSFFWIGLMWVAHHNNWYAVKKINLGTIMLTLCVLFFSSLFPYTTSLVAENFYNPTAQVFYGLLTILIFLMNIALSLNLNRINPEVHFKLFYTTPNSIVFLDLALKTVGMILSVTVYPPAMMIAIVLASLLLVFGLRQQKENTGHAY